MIAVGSVHLPDVPIVAQWSNTPRADGSSHPVLLIFNFGAGRIFGTVKVTPATPVSRLVRLHDQLSGRVVAETQSNPATGAYSFENLRTTSYYVTSFDSTKLYNGVIASDLIPQATP